MIISNRSQVYRYCDEYKAVLDHADALGISKPTIAVSRLLNTFIVALKNAGIWVRLDLLYVWMHDGSYQFSCINFKNPGTFTLIPSSTRPRQLGNVGMTTEGLASCTFSTNWTPSIDGVNYTLNDASIFFYDSKDITSNGANYAALSNSSTRYTLLNTRLTSTLFYAINSAGSGTFSSKTNANSNGLYVVNRINSTTTNIYKDGSKMGGVNDSQNAGSAMPSVPLYIFGRNNSGTIDALRQSQGGVFGAGANLDSYAGALYTAWNNYRTGVAALKYNQASFSRANYTIYAKSSWSDISDFTNNGATVSVISNKLSFSGGSNTNTQILENTRTTIVRKWRREIDVTVNTKDATSYGFGIGLRSLNQQPTQDFNLAVKFNGTGSNAGKISILSQTGYTEYVVSETALSWSDEDTINLIVERDDWTIRAYARNKTTDSISICAVLSFLSLPHAAPFVPNTGRLSIWSYGGDFTVNAIYDHYHVILSPRIMVIADSKFGYDATYPGESVVSLLNTNYGNAVISNSGPSDSSREFQYYIDDIRELQPQCVLIFGRSNDPRYSINILTTIANNDSFVSLVNAEGIRVVQTTGFYETSGNDQTGLRNHINSTYNSADIIDTLSTVISLNDNIHPTSSGMSTLASTIIAANKL